MGHQQFECITKINTLNHNIPIDCAQILTYYILTIEIWNAFYAQELYRNQQVFIMCTI